ncbi:hypothetical protein BGZ65_010186, partial [Modicella reniformis]
YQQQQQQYFPQKSVSDQNGNNGPEVVLEMPPPKLGNRKPRKMYGQWSLNNKYDRMKNDMELLAQGSSIQQLRSSTVQYRRPAPAFNNYYTLAPGNVAYNAVVSPSLSVDGNIASQPLQGYCESQPFVQASNLTSPETTTMFSPNKRVRFDESPSFAKAAINSNAAIGGGAYSTPHFRFSSGSCSISPGRTSAEVPAHYVPYSEPMQQISSDDFEVDPVLRRMLLEQEPFQDPTFEMVSQPVATRQEPANSEPHRAPQAESPVQSLQSNGVLVSGEAVSKENESHSGFGTEGILDERPLTIRERIHRMGFEIRTSAAASITRFGIKTSSSLEIRQMRDAEREREKQRLRQKSRFESFDSKFYPSVAPEAEMEMPAGQDSTSANFSYRTPGDTQVPTMACDILDATETDAGGMLAPGISMRSTMMPTDIEQAQEAGANIASRVRMALPTPLLSIDENAMLLIPANTKDGDADLDSIAMLEREIQDLTASPEQ